MLSIIEPKFEIKRRGIRISSRYLGVSVAEFFEKFNFSEIRRIGEFFHEFKIVRKK